MAKKYNSPISVGYRKPIVIYSEDPRAKNPKELERYAASIGAEVIIKQTIIQTMKLEEI